MYDPLTGSWLTPDPLAHKYTSWSPYAYCAGNPVNFVDPDGLDIWHITSNGEVSRIKKSNTDVLYYVDNEGKRSSEFINIKDRNLLDAFSDKKGKASFTTNSNIDDLFKMFLFASNNTDVEWVMHRDINNNYTLGTIHNEDSAGSWTDYGIEKPIASVHSHPGIPANVDDEIFSMSIDWLNVKNDIVINKHQTRMNYVYFPKSKRLYHVEHSGYRYIRKITTGYSRFYFGTLNHR